MTAPGGSHPRQITATTHANVTIVDTDVDSAEALQSLIEGFPVVAEVRAVSSAAEAIELLRGDSDVVGFAAAGTSVRHIVLIDARQDEATACAALTLLRSELPGVSIVLLCVYPDHSLHTVSTLADRCVPKDTSITELHALFSGLLESAAP